MNKSDKVWTFALALAAGFAGGVVASRLLSFGRTFTAQEFRVVDKEGKMRARLGMVEKQPAPGFGADSGQEPALSLYDKNGKARARLFLVYGERPSLDLYNRDGKNPRISLKLLGPQEGPELFLFDKQRQIRASLSLDSYDEPGLNLSDKDGKLRAGFFLFKGHAELGFLDEKGKVRTVLGYYDSVSGKQRPESSLLLLDKNEKVIWQAP